MPPALIRYRSTVTRRDQWHPQHGRGTATAVPHLGWVGPRHGGS